MLFSASIAAVAVLATANAAAVNTPTKCAADNCLRALRSTQIPSRVHDSQEFCASFTKAGATNVPIPTYASEGCKDNQNAKLNERVSSACACLPTPTREPCAEVSASWATQAAATATVSAKLAHECLNSVPFNKERGVGLVDALEPYIQWQTDSEYLKDPPEDYERPGYDVFAALKEIRAKAATNKYASEYEFQKDIQEKVYYPAASGHFVFTPDSLGAFSFRFPRGVVSYSDDGKSLPIIKLYEDFKKSAKSAPILKSINDQDASKFLYELGISGTNTFDLDAAYNTMFYQPNLNAGEQGYFGSVGRFSTLHHGDNTKFEFSNGTTVTLDNYARVTANMTGVVDGPSFYKAFCEPLTQGEKEDHESGSQSAAPDPPLAGYPKPILRTDDNTVTGYYLEGPGVDHVGVLAVRGFVPKNFKQFQAVTQDFLATAKHAGKTKIVIDLQTNHGGIIVLGYDLFRQFFPQTQEHAVTRWKNADTYIDITRAISDSLEGFDPFAPGADYNKVEDYGSTENWRNDLNSSLKHFVSYEDKFASHIYKNTPYTNLMAWDFNNPLIADPNHGVGINITGYADRKNITQHYTSDDLVLLYDGYCASTCTITSEMFRLTGNVKSVAMGGRPRPGPQQGVGAVRGSQVYAYSYIYGLAQRAINVTTDSNIKARLSKMKDLSLFRADGEVNTRDQIVPPHVEDGVPSQFVATYSECRLYWTEPMLNDIQEVWKAAARSAFNGAKCNYGGIERSTATPRSEDIAAAQGPAPALLSRSLRSSPKLASKSAAWKARFNVEVPKFEL